MLASKNVKNFKKYRILLDLYKFYYYFCDVVEFEGNNFIVRHLDTLIN